MFLHPVLGVQQYGIYLLTTVGINYYHIWTHVL